MNKQVLIIISEIICVLCLLLESIEIMFHEYIDAFYIIDSFVNFFLIILLTNIIR